MSRRPKGEPCAGSEAFPNNFDGEYTVCSTCRRRLNLNPEGLVPQHDVVPPPGYRPRSETRRRISKRGEIGAQIDSDEE